MAARPPRLKLSLWVLCLIGSANGQQALDWKAGVARANITPQAPIRMAGYATRTTPSQGVDIDLHLKALALEDRDGQRALILTADIIGFPGSLAERIARRLEVEGRVARNRILLVGSHTHAGPIVTVRLGDRLTPEERDVIERYTAWLENTAVETGLQAFGKLEPVELAWSTGVASFVMNRREFTEKGVILGVNARRPVDRSVPVLRVSRKDGTLLAIVFSVACHPTTLTGEHLRINGDYPGYAQAYLEGAFPGTQAMFLIGCGGDANPYPRGTLELAQRHGLELGREVQRVVKESPFKTIRGPLRAELDWVDLPLQKFERAQLEGWSQQKVPSYYRFFVDEALALLRDGKPLPSSYRAPFAVWQFGQDLTLVAFSGETVSGYVYLTERAIGPLNLWVIGYANDLFGYLPTAQVLEEGGYETRGLYTSVGLFTPEVERVVMESIVRMAHKVGRTLREPAATGRLGLVTSQ